MPRRAARPRRRQRRARPRLHAGRVVAAALIAAAIGVTLLMTAFSGNGTRVRATTLVAPAQRLLPARPLPQVVATRGALRLELPIAQSRVTAIGYHAPSMSGALALTPVGQPANEGLLARVAHKLFGGGGGGLRYYLLGGTGGSDTGVLNVGAPSGTDVYSPVDGTIVGLTNYVVSGHSYGVRLDIQPAASPSLVVSLTNLRPDPGLTVGSTVKSTVSKVGNVIDMSHVETQALADYTQDHGNHGAVEVRQAAALAVP
ncbi:MAG TPA: hypothetical protein VFU10_08595 [Gaiellaceae bacterium]|nr:hypothetical protein [Gaiellaceae bacterium]